MFLRDEIPEDLLSTAEQAVTWLNQQRGTEFSLTGLADEPDDKPVGEPTDLDSCPVAHGKRLLDTFARINISGQ